MRTNALPPHGLRSFLWVLLSFVFALAACQPVPAPGELNTPSAPDTAIPTSIPTATRLEPTAAQASAAAPQLLKEFAVTYPSRLIWSADGARLAVLGEAGLTLLDAETLQPILERAIASPARVLDFSLDGKTLAFTPDGQTIELDDVDSDQTPLTIQPGGAFQRAVFSPDGRWLAVDSMDQMAYTLWDVASGQRGVTLSGFVTAAPIYAADFSPSGRKLVWYARGTIQEMDIASGKLAAEIGHEDFISAFAISPDDGRLATAAGGTLNGQFVPLIHMWNPQSGAQIGVYPQSKFASALAFSPDGATLAAGIGGDVLLLNPSNGQVLQSFHASDDAVTALAYSPDGSRLATAGSDGQVRLWNLK
ncbi:protein containg FOG: WD40 repeat [Longilinea arvoryzae]|uniref:Protein containg FOG: WD40 repeat n=1 Tax=Longilinea arvoryzae TaxID=360412 RepID=A0A0S7B912_9CHLR|nr:hypothetical protein [Longilinea arvoryzae]GAP13758.1 protein containg FOG: WD40 repeat [Longilinea arvoryzae]